MDLLRVLSRMRKVSVAVLATAAVISGTAGLSSAQALQAPAPSGSPFLLGMSTPLTGSQAEYGAGELDAVKLAVAYVDAHGGMDGHPIQLLTWDNKADPATGAAGAQYFVAHRVNAVEGFFDSDVTIPAVRILERARIPLFGGNPSTPELAQLKLTNFVRITGDDAFEGLVQAEYAYSTLHAKTAVVLQDEEVFGEAFAQAFVNEFKKLGGKVVLYEGVDPSSTNYSSVLSAVAAKNPDVLEWSGFYEPAGLLVKQARQMGLKSTFITDSSVFGQQFLTIAGKAAAGAYMTNLPLVTSSNPLASYLVKNMNSQYKLQADPIDANAFDAIIAMWKTADMAHSITPAALLGDMHKVSFTGATGPISFLRDGDRRQLNYLIEKVTPNLKYTVVKRIKITL